MISQEAKSYIVDYIQECKKRHLRCIRIIHGKGIGSKNKEPVLRNKVKNWLAQKDEVIAYAQAPKNDGGSGAVIVLLKEYN
jgi:DNA-nicking Smr family endonuclease